MLLTREQLQDRLIALHRASLQLVQDVSLETLLERIAAVACEQANARYAALGVLDDQGALKQFITVGIDEDQIKRIPHPPRGMGLIGVLMDTDQTVRLEEIAADERSKGFPSGHPQMRSFLGVPIRSGGIQLGQIYLTEKLDGQAFTADDETIIQMLAAYAATAIQNARLYAVLRERDTALTHRNEDLALLNDVATALTGSLEMDEILNRTLALVMKYMKVEAGEIFLLEDDQHTLRMVLHRGEAADAFWVRNRFEVGQGIIGSVAESARPVVVNDLARDVRFLRDAVVQAGFRQMTCLPLISTSDRLVGVLSVFRRSSRETDERGLGLLEAVGRWAGLAIENARLHIDARRLAVLEERERIGMDLHDGIIQSIFGVGLSLENIIHLVSENPDEARQGLRRSIDDLNQTIRDLRAYILDLRPRQLGSESLLAGLNRLLAEFRANTLSEGVLNCPQAEIKDLPQANALALFHICQEALANIAKHAGAKRVEVVIWTTSERVLMEVRDNGHGFNLEEISLTIGHGLANMQTRARNVGGEVDISSTIGEGTTILAWVPRHWRR